MSDTELRAEVEAFLALPKAERKAQYESLDRPVKLRVRKVLEARRGIAYRADGGIPVFTKDEYVRQLLQKQEKLNDTDRRKEVLCGNIAELKNQLLENYGEDALVEAETALEALNAGNE